MLHYKVKVKTDMIFKIIFIYLNLYLLLLIFYLSLYDIKHANKQLHIFLAYDITVN